MAKRNKRSKTFPFKNPFGQLPEETLRGVWVILLLIVAFFLVFAAVGYAGIAGKIVFGGLYSILGWGFILLPLLFTLIAIVLIRPIEYEFGAVKIFSATLFLLAGQGIIELMFSHGGSIGRLVLYPLTSFFDIYVTVFVLWGVALIAPIILLDLTLTSASFPLFTKFLSLIRRPENDPAENVGEESAEDSESENVEEGYEPEDAETEVDSIAPPPPLSVSTHSNKGVPKGLGFTRMQVGEYTRPPLSLLERDKGKPSVGDIKANANIIRRTLQNFGIMIEVDEISIGPSVTRYALKPAEGVRLSRIMGLQNNLELALAAHPVRIEAPIPGRALVGIEVPNIAKTTVGLATLLSSDQFQHSEKPLLVTLGKDIAGKSHFADIAKMPHLLIAGATGAGKSVTIHALITSLLFRNSPEALRFIMIDPKRVELTLYNNIPHLLTPVVTDAKKAILSLKWAAKEMDRRYDILETEKVRDIYSYHKNILEPALLKKKTKKDEEDDTPEAMPYIVIVVDEIADIMQAYPRELESAIVRLAQMSRAVGIHLILSTQRPSVNIITGLIKANIPSRIALQVSSQIDSRTILDAGGAEKLLGNGDMLYLSSEMSKPHRIQSAFVSETELKQVVSFLTKHNEEYAPSDIQFSQNNENVSAFGSIGGNDDTDESDELYDEAKEMVEHAGKASTSYLQRKLRIGYARAARLVDMLEEKGVVGPADGSKPRDILTQRESSGEDAYEEKREQ